MIEYPILEEKLLVDLFKDYKLEIPKYQRPYKWRKEHVIRLLDDLYFNVLQKKEGIYRIGSLILNRKDHNVFEIVDGQQRLTTLSMILHYLKKYIPKEFENVQRTLLQNHKYLDVVSKNNIVYNYQYIIVNKF